MIHSDVGVYVLHQWQGDNTEMICNLYVDNLLLLGEDQSKIEDVKHQLGKLYQMKDLGPASSYLGIRITRDHKHQIIWIDNKLHWKCIKEVQTSRCKEHKNTTPCQSSLREVRGSSHHWNQDMLSSNDQDTYLCCHWYLTQHHICSHTTIIIQQ